MRPRELRLRSHEYADLLGLNAFNQSFGNPVADRRCFFLLAGKDSDVRRWAIEYRDRAVPFLDIPINIGE